jgi:hypothetical protein
MKIEIDIDIESMVKEAIKAEITKTTTPTTISDNVVVQLNTPTKPQPVSNVEWEYAPQLGKRRNKTEQALHNKELELGRILTPEEKGKIDAYVELDDEAKAKAKEATKKKAHIDEIAAEGMAAAAKELAAEADAVTSSDGIDSLPESILDAAESFDTILTLTSTEEDTNVDEVMPGEEEEETIPKTEEVSTPGSLFT